MTEPAPKKGIVWLASYPRSGNTWTRNFLYNLINITGDRQHDADINKIADTSVWDIVGKRFEGVVGKPLKSATREEIAAARPLVQRDIADGATGPILVKTHNALVMDFGTPTINMRVTAGAVYIVRNPLDAVISNAHHFTIDIDAAITRLGRRGEETEVTQHTAYEVYGSWSENVSSWTAKPHRAILAVRYEDMLAEPVKTFRKLANHLMIEASNTQLEQAIELSSFERAKKQEQEKGYRERPENSKAFFREGRAEQWRDVLNEAQIARIVSDHREQMARFGYIPAGL